MSTTSGAISSPGLGSGLDVNSIVTKLMAVEQQPLTLLNQKASTLNADLSAYGTIKSQLASLQDASSTLMSSTGWSGRTLTSSNTTALTGSATSTAVNGVFNVTVNQLAQAQSNFSGGITSGSQVTGSNGTLRISLGAWSGGTFTANSGTSYVDVAINAGDTMSTVASKINAANAGVSATVVTTGGKDQLILQGSSTGAQQGFQIQAFDSSAPTTELTGTSGLALLSYSNTNKSLTLNQNSLDASATVGGVTVTSATNTMDKAIPGVTLNLSQVTSSPITVTVANDTAAMRKNIQAFVDAYNTLAKNLTTQTAYDAATKTAGVLQGDSTAVGMLNTLARMVGATGPTGSSFTRLSDIGIQMQQDGTLSINDTKLSAAMANPSALQSFFGAVSTDPTTSGMATRFYNYAFGANSVGGLVSTATDALQRQLTSNSNDINALNDRLSATQARLYAQFNALDTQMAQLNSLSTYVTQQVTQWSKA